MVERAMDALDMQLLKGEISQEEYEEEVRELDHWSREKLAAASCQARYDDLKDYEI
jgi:hypothetical protein